MNIFVTIVRWFTALAIGGFMLGFVVIAVPVSVFGTQLLDSSSATRWINALTNDKKAMESFTEGVFTGIGNTDNSAETDPAVRQVMVTMSNPNSALGKAARKVFTSEIIGKNIKQNASSFYNWLDAKTPTLKFTFYVGGTTADQIEFVSEMLKVHYETLPVCTTAQRQSIMKDQTSSLFNVPCSFGTLQKTSFNKEASDFLTSKNIKPYLNTGAPWVTEAKESDRKSVIALKNMAKVGLIVTWVVVAFSVLFMVLLFTPAGINWIMTGGIVGLTGMILLGMGGGAVALLSSVNPYGTATESITEAFGNTLGKPITVHGVMLMILGAVLIAIGIFKLLKKKPVKKEILTQSVSTVSTPAPAVAATVVEERPTVEAEVVKAPVQEVKPEEVERQ